MTEIAAVLGWNFAIVIAAMLVLWLISMRLGDVSYIDAFWGVGFVMIAAATLLMVGAGERRALLTALTALWGLRLGLYLFLRWRKTGPDRRYVRMLAKNADAPHFATLTKVFLPQGVLMWIVSLPLQLGQIPPPQSIGVLGVAGAALTLIGVAFESIGDWQLNSFKARPENAGRVMDRGLWRYTRHPNYFGDTCVWWGLYLIAAETSPGHFAIIGPVLMTYLLMKWSGAPLLERHLMRSRPDYAAYAARTSAFIPLPPKRVEATP